MAMEIYNKKKTALNSHSKMNTFITEQFRDLYFQFSILSTIKRLECEIVHNMQCKNQNVIPKRLQSHTPK